MISANVSAAAMDDGGGLECYVELVCGTGTERTKTKKKTLKPYRDEAFAFDVPHGVGGLETSLYYENKQLGCATFLGSYILKLDELSENDDVVQSFAMQPRGLNPGHAV